MKIVKSAGIVLLFAFFCPTDASALLNLTAAPSRGGSTITFGREKAAGNAGEERVSISVSTDTAVKYRVYQLFPEPLRRDDGRALSSDNVSFYAVSGSNSRGTLMCDSPAYASGGSQPLYQSDDQGSADSFDVIYTLNAAGDVPPGMYTGRVTYVLEPQAQGESVKQVTVNMYADIEASAKFEVCDPSGGGRILRFGRDGLKKTAVLRVTAPTETGYRIRQVIGGELLPSGQFPFSVDKVKGEGSVEAAFGNFESGDRVIYSDPVGQNCELLLSFDLGGIDAPAGTYTTNVQYIVEPMGGGKTMKDAIQLVLNIEPIFDISASTESGIDLLKFQNLKPGEEPRLTKVHLKVDTNKGKPYQVNQMLSSQLLTREGKKIPAENFTVEISGGNPSGKTMVKGEAPVTEGVTVLYVSDGKGERVELDLVYKLKITSATEAGDYISQLKYSISEL